MPVRVIDIAVVEGDESTVLVDVETTVGTLKLIGECEPFDRDLVIDRAHVQGLRPGALGRQGLNEVAQAIMEKADVDTLTVHGAVRSTGRNPGRRPEPFVARRRPQTRGPHR